MENSSNSAGAEWHQVRMLVGAASGFLVAVFVGVASADETPTSVPVDPDVLAAPAVVVSAGADNMNTNAVSRLSALSASGTEYGTSVQLDDGRIGTVAHALIDARSVGIGPPGDVDYGPLVGADAIEFELDEVHDLAAIRLPIQLGSMAVADEPVAVGDDVAIAGYGKDERLEVVPGVVLYRGIGAAYGVSRPEIIVVSASVEEGWSGGPVTNVDGEVVAITVGLEQLSGVAIAVPVEHLPELGPVGP